MKNELSMFFVFRFTVLVAVPHVAKPNCYILTRYTKLPNCLPNKCRCNYFRFWKNNIQQLPGYCFIWNSNTNISKISQMCVLQFCVGQKKIARAPHSKRTFLTLPCLTITAIVRQCFTFPTIGTQYTILHNGEQTWTSVCHIMSTILKSTIFNTYFNLF